jgi:2-polyprenyl-3-methyl-5-hydroxy-6-metoxy-1,4-benzoquinol methylase
MLEDMKSKLSRSTSAMDSEDKSIIEIDQSTHLSEVDKTELLKQTQPSFSIIFPDVYIKAIKNKLSVLPDSDSEGYHYSDHTFKANGLNLEVLFNQYWFPEMGFLISSDGRVWRHSTLGQYEDPGFVSTGAIEIDKKSGKNIFNKKLLHKVPVIKEPFLITSHFANNNFGHFLLDMMPLIKVGKDLGLNFASRPINQWQIEAYKLLGIEPGQIKIFSEKVVFLKQVITSNRHNAAATYAASPSILDLSEFVIQNLKNDAKKINYKKIYLSRSKDDPKKRNMTNRSFLEKSLSEEGFAIINPISMSLIDQVKLFRNAEIIVSEFGAQLANVIFCKAGTSIIEIIPNGTNDPWSIHLCGAMNLNYVVIFQKVDDSMRSVVGIANKKLNNIYFSYSVDVEKIINIVRKVQKLRKNFSKLQLDNKPHKYDYSVDVNSNSAGANVIRMVGKNKKVLEVGCGPGSLAKVLSGIAGCKITGLEFDIEAIEKAKEFCEKIIHADLNGEKWLDQFKTLNQFDVVLVADVLEHLNDPLTRLTKMVKLIKKDGFIVISLPHAGHASVLACMINNDFRYGDWGLLDRTHIKFFCMKNIQDLIDSSNLKIIEFAFVRKHPHETEFSEVWARTDSSIRKSLLTSDYSNVYQVVIKAVPLTSPLKAIKLMPHSKKRQLNYTQLKSVKSALKKIVPDKSKSLLRKFLKMFGIFV